MSSGRLKSKGSLISEIGGGIKLLFDAKNPSKVLLNYNVQLYILHNDKSRNDNMIARSLAKLQEHCVINYKHSIIYFHETLYFLFSLFNT